ALDLLFRREPVLVLGAVLDVDERRLHEASEVAGRAVHHRRHAVRLAVVDDEVSDTKLGGGDHGRLLLAGVTSEGYRPSEGLPTTNAAANCARRAAEPSSRGVVQRRAVE